MEQAALYSVLETSGFTVQSFEHHPQVFGNWFVRFSRGRNIYEIIGDRCEGCLMLRRDGDNQKVKLFENVESELGQAQDLSLIINWLSEVKNHE